MEGANFRPKSEPARQPKRDHVWQVPPIIVAVLGTLAFVYFVPPLIYGDWEAREMAFFAFNPARFVSAGTVNQPFGAAYYSLLTHGLLHANLFHLFSNSIWLLIFGTPVARILGSLRFLILFGVSIVAGALLSLFVDWGQSLNLVGASGGVSGLIAAAVPIMNSGDARGVSHSSERPIDFRILPFSDLLRNQKALFFIAVWLTLTLFTGTAQFIIPTAFLNESRIAWEAHLGGFLAGLAMIYALAPSTISKP